MIATERKFPLYVANGVPVSTSQWQSHGPFPLCIQVVTTGKWKRLEDEWSSLARFQCLRHLLDDSVMPLKSYSLLSYVPGRRMVQYVFIVCTCTGEGTYMCSSLVFIFPFSISLFRFPFSVLLKTGPLFGWNIICLWMCGTRLDQCERMEFCSQKGKKTFLKKGVIIFRFFCMTHRREGGTAKLYVHRICEDYGLDKKNFVPIFCPIQYMHV